MKKTFLITSWSIIKNLLSSKRKKKQDKYIVEISTM